MNSVHEVSEEELAKQQALAAAGFDDDDIPEDNEVNDEGQRDTYRFAGGEIVTGKDATKKVLPSITGRVIEVRTYKGQFDKKLDDGRTVKRDRYAIEAVWQGKHGLINVAQSLLDQNDKFKVSRSALDLIWALTQVQPGKIYRVTAAQGEPWRDDKGNEMKPSTYVNFAEILPERDDNGKFKTKRLMREKLAPGAKRPPMEEQFQELEAALRKHPLWKERKARVDKQTHFYLFCEECKAKGWPTPEQAPAEWLALMAKSAGEAAPRASLSDWPDDIWGEARQKLAERQEILPSLVAVRDRLAGSAPAAPAQALSFDDPAPASAPAATGEYDPFADQ